MRLVPRSLFGRNLLLIVLLIAVAQIGSFLLVRHWVTRPRLDQISDGSARNISAIRAGLIALPAGERAAFVDAFNRRGAQGLPATASVFRPGPTPMERLFVRAISERVAADGAQVIWRREAGGSLALRLEIDATPYWVTLPGVLPAREFNGSLVAGSLAAALLALVGAVAIQRRLNRPLARVVRAADQLGRGARPAPLAEDGPIETATLARSFNRLAESLARTDRERALMLAGVSHDLRTPLAKLRLGVEILSDPGEPALTASMNRSIEEMDAIVGQFLDFARADDAEPAVAGSVDHWVRALAAACADHGQPVTLALGDPPQVRLKPQALTRCLTNLVANAFRHGLPPVTLRSGADSNVVWVEVADLGTGIPASEAEALKQPFRRAQASRSGTPGAGLGLAIVDRLVRSQGGNFELLANAPQGLRARISLPRER